MEQLPFVNLFIYNPYVFQLNIIYASDQVIK